MNDMLGVGVLVMIAADGIVGVRLLALAGRTRQLPELCFGLSFLLMGVVGYPLAIVARKATLAGAPMPGLLPASFVFQNLASLAMLVATWRTFRPQARWLRRAVWLAAAAFVASLVGDSLVARGWTLRDGGPWYQLGFWLRASAYFWSAVEATRYHGVMRRRLAIGLADPVVADRFRLWAISSGAVSAAFLAFFVGHVSGASSVTATPVLAATSAAGLVAGVTMYLAFVPPGAYVRRVRTRAPAR